MNFGVSEMIAVIMAGGKGTRVASVNEALPKPLLPVKGKPVLEWQLECLKRQNITHIVMTIGYLGEQIERHFGDGSRFGVTVEYVREDVPLGTAGALYDLKGRLIEDFLLINGDLIFDVDLHHFMAFHKARGALATLLVHPNDHPQDSGVIVADEDGCVRRWLTKEEERGWVPNCVNAGIHALSPELLRSLTGRRKTDLDRELLKPSLPSGRVFCYKTPEYIKDMGTPERIREVEQDIASGRVQAKNLRRTQRAVFLDRDGTINRYAGFVRRPEEIELLPGAAEAIRRINQSGYLAIVVTNQPVIARGEATWDDLREIHWKLETLLGREGAYVDDIFICPHHPHKGFEGERPEYKIECGCRKPKPGLLLRAAEKYNIGLSESWMIGDSQSDMLAGEAAGCRTVRLDGETGLNEAVKRLLSEGA